MIKFPEHKIGLTLSHNKHKEYYLSIKDYILSEHVEFSSEEEKNKVLETNEIWELQWYPDTPVGFYSVAAATLEECLRIANEVKYE